MSRFPRRTSRRPGLRRAGVGAALVSLLAGLLLLAAPAPAMACTCAEESVQEAADQADVVISGTIRLAERSGVREGRPNRDRLTLTVDVDRVYKGTITRDAVQVVSPASPGACGLGVVPEEERWYVYATAEGSRLSTNICAGTRKASGDYAAQVREALGDGTRTQDSSSPTSAPPERTTVDDGPPPDYGRTAAPGGALAIVGLLGLLVVRRRARRG